MARIKGKWVGQVVLEIDEDEVNIVRPFEMIKNEVEKAYTRMVKDILMDEIDEKIKVTVTQLHADLYRDEPSEWTKEEAT